MTAPRVTAIHETVLYGPDLEALNQFYARVLGLRTVSRMGSLGVALKLPDDNTLLLFDPSAAAAPGRDVPSHGATGEGHVAFTVGEGELDGWRGWLAEHDIPIETEVTWDRGGVSLYVRDPAGNSVELIDGPIWPD